MVTFNTSATKSLDDTLSEPTKITTHDIMHSDFPDKKLWCPHLRIEGDYWPYCSLNFSTEDELPKGITRQHLVRAAYQDTAEIQLWCMSGRQEKCIFYQGTEPSKAQQYVKLVELTISGRKA